MTRPTSLHGAISRAIADAGHDSARADDLFREMTAGLALLIAYRSGGSPAEASILCERAATGLVREAFEQVGFLSGHGAGRLH